MTKKQNTDEQEDPTLDAEDLDDTKDPEDQATDDPSQAAADETQDTDEPIDWEQRYQGLQKVMSKKDKDLATKTKQVKTLVEQKEAAAADSTTKGKAASDLEKELEEAQEKLDTLQSDRDAINIQLSQQGIVMKDFPELAPLADFIPAAEDEEEFRANAKNLSDALGKYVDKGVDTALKGASPPGPTDTEEVPTKSEEDALWATLYSTAGIEGKEAEYQEARDKLDKIEVAREKQPDLL